MQKLSLLVILVITTAIIQAQADYNIELLGNVPLAAGEAANDIWGYVDGDGVEYAVMGTTAGTYIYSLEDPRAPVERARIPGDKSVWRDMKSYKDHIYVVADQGDDGLLVVDMSGAPGRITSNYYNPSITVEGETFTMDKAHNLFIDERGRMIIAGADIYSGTPIVFDLERSLDNPPFVGATAQRYAHDVYAYDNLLFTSDIYQGVLSTHDLTDPANIRRIGSVSTSNNFTHNAWAKLDNSTVFTTDERDASYVDAFDVSDPSEMKLVDKFRPNELSNTGSVPHNTHVVGDYLATSWYKDGVILTDATRPNNLVEIGRFDTHPQAAGGGFAGCWGAYPFLPSGLLLASDIQGGLFVLEPTYVRAAYLEGIVGDVSNESSLGDVAVEFVDEPTINQRSSLSGDYAIGTATPGAYRVRFSKEGYADETIPVTLEAGKVTRREVFLRPITNADLRVEVRAGSATGALLSDADTVVAFRSRRRVAGQLTSFYDVFAGKFGYQTKALRGVDLVDGTQKSVTVPLDAGYYDDFLFDNDWTVEGDAQSGAWELGVPQRTSFGSEIGQRGADVRFDYGNAAYVTGLEAGESVGANDVDRGTTTLISPEFSLDGQPDARIEFSYFFYNAGGGNTPNDALTFTLRGEREAVELLNVDFSTNGWLRFQSGPLGELLDLAGPLRLEVSTGDDAASGHLVEAGFDWFVVTPVARPVVSFSPASGCAPLQVSADFGTADSALFAITTSDTSRAIRASATSQTVGSAGVFDAVVEVPDGRGGIARFVYPNVVDVEESTTADFGTFIVGDTVYFENLSSNITSSSWDFGDGTSAEGPFVSHVFANVTDAEVTLTVEGPCGTDVAIRGLNSTQTSPTTSAVEPESLLELAQNPVTDYLQVAYAGTAAASLVLRNNLGQRVMQRRITPTESSTLEVAHLPAGVYYLQLAGRAESALQVLITH